MTGRETEKERGWGEREEEKREEERGGGKERTGKTEIGKKGERYRKRETKRGKEEDIRLAQIFSSLLTFPSFKS